MEPFDLDEPTVFGDGRGEARDVNVADQLVGWGTDQSSECNPRALLWQSPTDADPINLHTEVQDPLDLFDETIAVALTNPDPLGNPTIVGHNEQTGEALIWHKGEQWIVTVLNTQIDSAACKWSLAQAHDINESGWIVGSGQHDGTTRAFLLTPLGDCPCDTNDDGVVDVIDLLAVLAVFGHDCPIGVICRVDCNGDCTVNVQDTNALLGAWGPCPGGLGLQGGVGGGVPSLGQALQLMGFSSVPAFQTWSTQASEDEVFVTAQVLAAIMTGH